MLAFYQIIDGKGNDGCGFGRHAVLFSESAAFSIPFISVSSTSSRFNCCLSSLFSL